MKTSSINSALALKTAIVMVEELPDGYDLHYRFETENPTRIRKAEVYPCFHSNQRLKVVRPPSGDGILRPYTVVHEPGFTMPVIETYQLEKAIAYCDFLAKNIPELSDSSLFSMVTFKPLEPKIIAIANAVDLLFPEIED